MENDELDILTDQQVDPDALDVAWLEQTNLFYKYSNALNQAIDERNDKKLAVEQEKDRLEKVKSELDGEIREDPDAWGLQKTTDATVNAAILASDRYQSALEDYHETKRELNEAQSWVNKYYTDVQTMEQRKTALEQLVRLLNQEYFSSPSEPRNLKQEYSKKAEKTKEKAREKVKGRKNRRSK